MDANQPIPPTVPFSSEGAIAQDSATVLATVLQKILDQNKPQTSVAPSPDQEQAAQADQSTKEKGKTPQLPAGDVVPSSKQEAVGVLPNIIDQLFGGSDKKAPDKTKSPEDGAQPAQQYEGGITRLMNDLRGGKTSDGKDANAKQGTLGAVLKAIALFG